MPVRWRETMLALHELGAERFVEVGPGRVLTGLAKRTLSGRGARQCLTPRCSPAEPALAPGGLTRTPAAILSVATELPDCRVTSAELAERLGVSEDWIVCRTGIRERRQAAARRAPERLRRRAPALAPWRPPGWMRRISISCSWPRSARTSSRRTPRRSSPMPSAPRAPARSTSAPPARPSSPALAQGAAQDRERAGGARARGRRRLRHPHHRLRRQAHGAAVRRRRRRGGPRTGDGDGTAARSGRSCSAPTARTPAR